MQIPSKNVRTNKINSNENDKNKFLPLTEWQCRHENYAHHQHTATVATHAITGTYIQHQDVDRTLRGRVNQNDRGQG